MHKKHSHHHKKALHHAEKLHEHLHHMHQMMEAHREEGHDMAKLARAGRSIAKERKHHSHRREY